MLGCSPARPAALPPCCPVALALSGFSHVPSSSSSSLCCAGPRSGLRAAGNRQRTATQRLGSAGGPVVAAHRGHESVAHMQRWRSDAACCTPGLPGLCRSVFGNDPAGDFYCSKPDNFPRAWSATAVLVSLGIILLILATAAALWSYVQAPRLKLARWLAAAAAVLYSLASLLYPTGFDGNPIGGRVRPPALTPLPPRPSALLRQLLGHACSGGLGMCVRRLRRSLTRPRVTLARSRSSSPKMRPSASRESSSRRRCSLPFPVAAGPPSRSGSSGLVALARARARTTRGTVPALTAAAISPRHRYILFVVSLLLIFIGELFALKFLLAPA